MSNKAQETAGKTLEEIAEAIAGVDRTFEIPCDRCKRYHPRHTVPKTRKRHEKHRGNVVLPGGETVTIEDCENVKRNTAIYRVKFGCPICSCPLTVFLHRNPELAKRTHEPEWQPYGEECQRFPDCPHQKF